MLNKSEFYKDKFVIKTEWWLHYPDLPKIKWARLRIYNDGTADSCFGEGQKLFGFENFTFASYIISEDEYLCFEKMDREDEQEFGIELANILTPDWKDTAIQEFEYLGTY